VGYCFHLFLQRFTHIGQEMNAINTKLGPRFAGGFAEFLHALDQVYQYLRLEPIDAQAATLADAESFAPPLLQADMND